MHPVWDIPTRLFHWALVIAFLLSWISAEEDYLLVHQYSGYTVLVLVCFRIAWGFAGSIHSRFGDFLRTPTAVWKHLRGRGQPVVGHNPAGGWSMLLMLLLLLAQALTGLFNSDELMFDGPFYHALDSRWTDKLGALHEILFWILAAMIALHLCAVLYYQYWQRQDLLLRIIRGGEQGQAAPRPLWWAMCVLLFWVATLYTALSFAPEPKLMW